MSDARLACPTCRGTEGLWAEATFAGWHSVDAVYDGARRRLRRAEHGHPTHETSDELVELEPTAMGCGRCGWEGGVSGLLLLDRDGNVVRELHPGQGSLPGSGEPPVGHA